MLHTYEFCLCMWTFMVYVVFSLSYYGFFEISNKKVDLQFALCNKVNSNQALFLPLMIKLSNEKSQIKSGSRKELSKFLASKHKYPSLLCKWSKNTHHKIKAFFSLKDSFLGKRLWGNCLWSKRDSEEDFWGNCLWANFVGANVAQSVKLEVSWQRTA